MPEEKTPVVFACFEKFFCRFLIVFSTFKPILKFFLVADHKSILTCLFVVGEGVEAEGGITAARRVVVFS